MSVCFIKHKKVCESNQHTTSSKVLMIPHQQGIGSRKASKKTKISLTDSSRGILFCPSSKNTPSSTPSCVGSKREVVPEEKSNDRLLVDSSISPLVVHDDLKMGDMSGCNCSTKNHTLSQNDCDPNNGDVGSGCGFINSHNL